MVRLQDFVARLERSKTDAIARGAERIRKGGLALIDETFKTESDPYGHAWSSVKPHRGHISIEQDSGELRRNWQAFATNGLIRWSNDLPYACRQNYGYTATNQPPRRMIPSQQLGFPVPWVVLAKSAFVEMTERVYQLPVTIQEAA